MTRGEYLADVARRYLGVHEVGGDNCGPEVEEFQSCLGGKPHGEAWCMAFVQFCVKKVERELLVDSELARSEGCLAVWHSTSTKLRVARPKVGDIVIWQKNVTQSGHCGIVVETQLPLGFYRTIEGNTSAGPGIQREGNGVYRKTHLLEPHSSAFQRLGFLRPFPQD